MEPKFITGFKWIVYINQFFNKKLPKDMGIVTLEITNIGEINQKHGHSGGDLVIQTFSSILQNAVTGTCFIGRNGGNKFVAIIRDCTQTRVDRFLESVQTGVNERNLRHEDEVIRYCIGTAFNEGDEIRTVNELLALSDKRAWENSGRR